MTVIIKLIWIESLPEQGSVNRFDQSLDDDQKHHESPDDNDQNQDFNYDDNNNTNMDCKQVQLARNIPCSRSSRNT